jgi:hypothetical protein
MAVERRYVSERYISEVNLKRLLKELFRTQTEDFNVVVGFMFCHISANQGLIIHLLR